jgi:hypothetical protein
MGSEQCLLAFATGWIQGQHIGWNSVNRITMRADDMFGVAHGMNLSKSGDSNIWALQGIFKGG